MVPAICFRNIPVRVAQIPLPHRRARVIARCSRGEHAHHEQNAAANVLPMKIAAYARLLNLDFTGTKLLRGTAHGVIFRLIEVDDKVGVKTNFGCEERSVENRVFRSWIPVQPGEITKRKGRLIVYSRPRRGRGQSGWKYARRSRAGRLC